MIMKSTRLYNEVGRIELTRLGADAPSIGAASLLLKDPIHAYDQ